MVNRLTHGNGIGGRGGCEVGRREWGVCDGGSGGSVKQNVQESGGFELFCIHKLARSF